MLGAFHGQPVKEGVYAPPWGDAQRLEYTIAFANMLGLLGSGFEEGSAEVERFARLGVVAAMQPYHAIDDGRWAERRIGEGE